VDPLAVAVEQQPEGIRVVLADALPQLGVG
jgi:hypothetical protein